MRWFLHISSVFYCWSCAASWRKHVVQFHLHPGLNATVPLLAELTSSEGSEISNIEQRSTLLNWSLKVYFIKYVQVEVWIFAVSAEQRVVLTGRRLASLPVNRGDFPARRGAPGDPPFSVVRARAALTVLVCRGSARWERNGLDFLFKVCDDYSQVSNCDLQMLGAAPVYVF